MLLVSLPIGLLPTFEVDSATPPTIGFHLTPIWVIPVYVMLLAYPLLSLDRIGMELQNLFSTERIDFLPLDSLSTLIERNVLELLHEMEEYLAAAPKPSDALLPPDAKENAVCENAIADIS